MSRSCFFFLITIACPVVLNVPSQAQTFTVQPKVEDPPYTGIIAEINNQCPPEYPELVTPLPEESELMTFSTETLMEMLTDLKTNGKNAKVTPRGDFDAGVQLLEKTIQQLESL